jgi:hypothetical protein
MDLLCENQRAAHHGIDLRLGLKIISLACLQRPIKGCRIVLGLQGTIPRNLFIDYNPAIWQG